MKHRLLEFLCCPTCGGDLTLTAFCEERVPTGNAEAGHPGGAGGWETVVQEGCLSCRRCKVWYPILDYVPVLLTFPTKVQQRFSDRHRQLLEQLGGYAMPNGKPEPGEESVQATFSDEWKQVSRNELSFLFTTEDLVELNRQVWLRPLQKTRDEFKTVLNVGVGLGQETVAVQRALGNTEIIGADLNFSLLNSGQLHRTTPRYHLVIASLFHLPFRRSSFDVVYSQGVLHHTYSTRAAFDCVADFVRPEGHLFIWVYALDSHLIPEGFKGVVLRAKRFVETILRPVVSRSPKLVRDAVFATLTAVLHLFIKTTVLHKEHWKLPNTNHGLRDWLSPRYAHRHSYNQVLEWFEQRSFTIAGVQSPAAYRKLFGKQLYGVGLLGQRVPRILSNTRDLACEEVVVPAPQMNLSRSGDARRRALSRTHT
jgi:uncharacterized protein YbaR (Trm112 family)/ubiquinone/menaquinone biosynthesis C-methylase UbiE